MSNQISGYSGYSGYPGNRGRGLLIRCVGDDEGKFVFACLYSFLFEVCVTLINFDLFVRKLVGITNLLC